MEGLAITLLEGMSYGRCCLVSDIPPNLEATAGWAEAFRSGDAGDLQRRLAALLADDERRRELGAGARRHVAECYSWESVAAAVAQLYRELVDEPRSNV
jgi:glycosyltransferase involved in cell wall biosynthesis